MKLDKASKLVKPMTHALADIYVGYWNLCCVVTTNMNTQLLDMCKCIESFRKHFIICSTIICSHLRYFFLSMSLLCTFIHTWQSQYKIWDIRVIYITYTSHIRHIYVTYTSHIRQTYVTYTSHIRHIYVTYRSHIRHIYVTYT